MELPIPIPTDNIYKFYALFGLILLLASGFAFLNVHNSYNERAFERFIEIGMLGGVEELSLEQELRKEILEAQESIDASDKKFYLRVIGGAIGIAIWLMLFGFYSWQTKIQPEQDRLISKQTQKLDLEIRAMRRSFRRG